DPQQVLSLQVKGTFRVSDQRLDSPPRESARLAALHAGTRQVFGEASCRGRSVIISGFGSVGSDLADALAAEGARVLVSDIDGCRKEAALARGYEWVEPDQAYAASADILVPAAVGGVLSEVSAQQITARLVVGPANNQLTDEHVADALARRGIVWVPDFIASAGGIIYALSRESEHYSHKAAEERVLGISDTVSHILELARSSGVTPLRAAQQIADRRISSVDEQASRV
ncbi:hypothetical protein ABZ733_27540, partial [Streptomyces longwoodensis]